MHTFTYEIAYWLYGWLAWFCAVYQHMHEMWLLMLINKCNQNKKKTINFPFSVTWMCFPLFDRNKNENRKCHWHRMPEFDVLDVVYVHQKSIQRTVMQSTVIMHICWGVVIEFSIYLRFCYCFCCCEVQLSIGIFTR